MWRLIGGIIIGWGLGSNDSANIFGTGVAANVLKYRTAIILISVFVIMGALLEGHKGMDTVGGMTNISHNAAFIAAFSAGLCVAAFSYLSLPVSTSQAIMGAVLGVGMITGIPDFSRLYKVLLCWIFPNPPSKSWKPWSSTVSCVSIFILRCRQNYCIPLFAKDFIKLGGGFGIFTPIGAIVLSMILYPLLGRLFSRILTNLTYRNLFIKSALVFAGCYGAYSLGANNVANVTGVYVGSGLLTPYQAALIGSLSIASGVLTYSKKVMETVGRKIVELDGFSAFISEFSAAIIVHFFTQVGVPVSTSQAIVGGVTGVGLVKGAKTVSKKTLIEIGIGWISTPLSSGIVAYSMMKISDVVSTRHRVRNRII